MSFSCYWEEHAITTLNTKEEHAMKRLIILLVIALIPMIFAGSSSWAGSVTIPNTFVAGTTARASEVNANFSAVETAVDDNDARIATNAAALNGMPGIDYTTSTGSFLTTDTDTVVISQTITAPTAGYVIAIYGGIYDIIHQTGTLTYMRLWINTNGGDSYTGNAFMAKIIPANLPSDVYYSPASLFFTTSVPAGSTTFYVMGDSNQAAGSTDAEIYMNRLSLLFFPERY